MTRDDIRTAVDRFVKAWIAQDLEALLACYDEHAELVSPLFHSMKGIAAIEQAHQNLFLAFTNVETDVHDIVVDVEQGRAVLVFTMHATQSGAFLGFPASGRRTGAPGAFVFHFKDGRIVHERRVYDFAGWMMQLGILNAKGG